MSSSPFIHQNPRCRLAKLQGIAGFVVFERIGKQHYLMWRDGVATTEVRCVRGRWYWRGAGMCYADTRAVAAKSGWQRFVAGHRIGGKPLEPWSAEALRAMARGKPANVRVKAAAEGSRALNEGLAGPLKTGTT